MLQRFLFGVGLVSANVLTVSILMAGEILPAVSASGKAEITRSAKVEVKRKN
jgi:hypothetical protein